MDITHEKPTALAVQQNALTALLADPERLNALPVDKLERMFDMHERMHGDPGEGRVRAAFQHVQDQVGSVPKRGPNRLRRDGKPADSLPAARGRSGTCSARSCKSIGLPTR